MVDHRFCVLVGSETWIVAYARALQSVQHMPKVREATERSVKSESPMCGGAETSTLVYSLVGGSSILSLAEGPLLPQHW